MCGCICGVYMFRDREPLSQETTFAGGTVSASGCAGGGAYAGTHLVALRKEVHALDVALVLQLVRPRRGTVLSGWRAGLAGLAAFVGGRPWGTGGG